MAGLQNGVKFPALKMAGDGGGEIVIPDLLMDFYGVILAYRGSGACAATIRWKTFRQCFPS